MLTAMMQPALALTAHEYGEWGDVRVDQCALDNVCFTLFPPPLTPKLLQHMSWFMTGITVAYQTKSKPHD